MISSTVLSGGSSSASTTASEPAPLQYLAVIGLRRYGEAALARTIATRWIRTNVAYYAHTGKLVEKYDIGANAARASAGGGEYPLQDGFGWTNGVLRTLLQLYPGTVDINAAVPAASASAAPAATAAPPAAASPAGASAASQ